MGVPRRLGQPVEAGSSVRPARRWRVLLAHDATAATCNSLIDAVEAALGNADVNESSSVDDARLALRLGLRDEARAPFHLAMVCLDLHPAPLGGVRLAQEIIGKHRLPVILVTRSLRWIPAWAVALRDLPWVTPEATAEEVARAVSAAMAQAQPVGWVAGYDGRTPGGEGDTELLARQAGGE
jgi:hypothetical protein